jgi:osmotically-inducible protein OsmY
VAVQVDGRTVTLRGEVSSDDERRHVESLVRITPGVREIHNELTVKQ